MTVFDISLDQETADRLIAMEKYCQDRDETFFPAEGQNINLPLVSRCGQERFFLDIGRGRIELRKVTYQNRARQLIPLVRLDIGGPPHTNPDGREIPSPHLHIYREGYGDRYAVEVPATFFSDTRDL